MKYFISVFLLLMCSLSSFAQSIRVTGTMFDPSGALVPNAQIKAVDEKGHSLVGASNSEGQFEIKLLPGLYSLEVSGAGFLTIKHPEFFVINSATGKMAIDFVLFGGKYHEPRGYSGADRLPERSLIRSYEVSYSPKLKEIRDEFAPIKSKGTKSIN